ncbi:cupin-like domain-containing protein [Pseudomarimonas salicorniae]|uniref:cupin-like domain-containing protein n=1 Tax=Pseudomarimonas salicorniae TaxID=2933270 RepID=UPI0031BA5527
MTGEVAELAGPPPARLGDALADLGEPRVLRGLVADWPMVQHAQASGDAAMDYLAGFDAGLPLQAWVAPPEQGGRFFYNQDLSGFNFRPERVAFAAVLDTLRRTAAAPAAPGIYVGSTTLQTYFPGLLEDNPLDGLPPDTLGSIWLGNRSRIAAHHDAPDNLACVAAGRRRFTLFPPDQIGNLYIGPLDFTPAGQAISLVDFAAPDFERFPRFADALEAARVVELDPGDALFIPSLWWHHVEGLDTFNVLVNFWWRAEPAWREPPMNALMHALISLRGLPARQRQAWEALFQHYVFADDGAAAAHIPAHARRLLGELDAGRVGEIREKLRQRLGR